MPTTTASAGCKTGWCWHRAGTSRPKPSSTTTPSTSAKRRCANRAGPREENLNIEVVVTQNLAHTFATRHYWANGVLTAALALEREEAPSLDDLEAALRHPARPLFLGRKTCLPSSPILLGRASGADVLSLLKAVPRFPCPVRPQQGAMAARWPADIGNPREEQIKPIYDQRDWKNQWHAGSRMVAEGPMEEAKPCT
jgi:hypothetical protein